MDQERTELSQTSGGKFFIGCLLMVLIGFGGLMSLFFWSVIDRGIKAFRLSQGHQIVVAEVYHFGMPRAPAHYEFFIQGVRYQGTSGMEARGEQVRVAYLPNNPAVNRPAEDLGIDMLMGVALPGLLLVGFLYIFLTRNDSVSQVAQRGEQLTLQEDSAESDRFDDDDSGEVERDGIRDESPWIDDDNAPQDHRDPRW